MGWDWCGVGGVWLGSLSLNELVIVVIVWFYICVFGNDFFENVFVMYGEFDVLYEVYVNGFEDVCL